jgi:hypothetical protein
VKAPTDCHVRSHKWDGTIAFVFKRALSPTEAKAFHEEVGVWPIHTVDGELRATKPGPDGAGGRSRSRM